MAGERSAALTFLEAVFGSKPDEAYIYVWRPNDGTGQAVSLWYQDITKAADYARENAGRDAYIGCALSPQDFGPRRRCKAEDALGITALWADVDFADSVHRKPNLPPDEDAALELLRDMPLRPSVIVHTGHGLQAWWVFHEAWVFESPEERREAAELVRRWQALLQNKAAARGWTVDATHDLARVLRLPGTTNTKAEPVPVRILELSERRYNPSDFEQYLPELEPVQAAGGAVNVVLNPNAEPPALKFAALLENDRKFKRTWHHERPDLQDQSPSGYDIALAALAIAAGWTDQEVANLLIAHRREQYKGHPDAERIFKKALRDDYIPNTIRKVRADYEGKRRAAEEAEARAELIAAMEEAAASGAAETPGGREQLLQQLSDALKIKVLRLVRYLTDPPEFRIFVISPRDGKEKSIFMGRGREVRSWRAFSDRVWEYTGHNIPQMKASEWQKVTAIIGRLWEDVELGSESTDHGAYRHYLKAYLEEQPPAKTVDESRGERPLLREDGSIVIFSSPFKTWLRTRVDERPKRAELGRYMYELGCQYQERIYLPGTSRSGWIIPPRLASELLTVKP